VLLALAALLVSFKTVEGKNLLSALGIAGLSTCAISFVPAVFAVAWLSFLLF